MWWVTDRRRRRGGLSFDEWVEARVRGAAAVRLPGHRVAARGRGRRAVGADPRLREVVAGLAGPTTRTRTCGGWSSTRTSRAGGATPARVAGGRGARHGVRRPGRPGSRRADAVWRVCEALPRQQRAAVVLRFYEDLEYAEIAAILGVAEATVRSHVHRALAALRAELTPAGGRRCRVTTSTSSRSGVPGGPRAPRRATSTRGTGRRPGPGRGPRRRRTGRIAVTVAAAASSRRSPVTGGGPQRRRLATGPVSPPVAARVRALEPVDADRVADRVLARHAGRGPRRLGLGDRADRRGRRRSVPLRRPRRDGRGRREQRGEPGPDGALRRSPDHAVRPVLSAATSSRTRRRRTSGWAPTSQPGTVDVGDGYIQETVEVERHRC